MAGSDTRQRAARRMSVVARSVAVCLVVGVAMVSATLLPIGAPAGADALSSQISSLQAQAALLQDSGAATARRARPALPTTSPSTTGCGAGSSGRSPPVSTWWAAVAATGAT